MSDEPQDLASLTGGSRSKLYGGIFVVVCVAAISGAMVWLERGAAHAAIEKLGCREDASLGFATRDQIDDVEYDLYTARACGRDYAVAVTPVFLWNVFPPRIGVGLPTVLDAHLGTTFDEAVVRSRFAR